VITKIGWAGAQKYNSNGSVTIYDCAANWASINYDGVHTSQPQGGNFKVCTSGNTWSNCVEPTGFHAECYQANPQNGLGTEYDEVEYGLGCAEGVCDYGNWPCQVPELANGYLDTDACEAHTQYPSLYDPSWECLQSINIPPPKYDQTSTDPYETATCSGS